MKSILKSSTFWLAILAIVVNAMEAVVTYAGQLGINQTWLNIIMFVIVILNRIRPKEAMNVYLFKKPGNAEAAK